MPPKNSRIPARPIWDMSVTGGRPNHPNSLAAPTCMNKKPVTSRSKRKVTSTAFSRLKVCPIVDSVDFIVGFLLTKSFTRFKQFPCDRIPELNLYLIRKSPVTFGR